jgi:hypothetical protein
MMRSGRLDGDRNRSGVEWRDGEPLYCGHPIEGRACFEERALFAAVRHAVRAIDALDAALTAAEGFLPPDAAAAASALAAALDPLMQEVLA